MTEDRRPLAELLAKAGNGDFLCNLPEAVLQLLMEVDVEGVIGAGDTSARRIASPTATATIVNLDLSLAATSDISDCWMTTLSGPVFPAN